eukprot:794765-Prymnesium_polylepis.1
MSLTITDIGVDEIQRGAARESEGAVLVVGQLGPHQNRSATFDGERPIKDATLSALRACSVLGRIGYRLDAAIGQVKLRTLDAQPSDEADVDNVHWRRTRSKLEEMRL